MAITFPKIKSVDRAKLEALSDSALRDRIQKSSSKLESKRSRYMPMVNAIQEYLRAYAAYREQDLRACQDILKSRDAVKSALPVGSPAAKPGGNAKPQGATKVA